MRPLWIVASLLLLLAPCGCTLDTGGAFSDGVTAPTASTAGAAQSSAPLVNPTAAPPPIAAPATAPVVAPPTQAAAGGAGGAWPAAAQTVQSVFCRELGLEPSQVTIAAVERGEWPDQCLGTALPGEVCGGGRVVGYRITLQVAGERYIYHTDEGGALVRPVMPDNMGQDETLLLWTRDDGAGCAMAMLSASRVEFGPCSGLALRGPLTPEQQATLQGWIARFIPFEAQTPAGFVQLAGRGRVQATPEEQRQLAEWASRVGQEMWQK